MNITPKVLISVAPFSDEKKKQLLEKFDTFTQDQKDRLTHASWTGIAMLYHIRLKYEFDKLRLAIAEGKKPFNQNDFEEIEAGLIHDLAQRLQSAESQEQIEDVRKQLEKYKTETGNPKTAAPLPHDPLSIGSTQK